MKPLDRGDRVEIEWLDIYQSPNDPPENAQLFVQHQIGFWWGEKESEGIPCTVITQYSNSESSQDGFTCIPSALVRSVRKLRKPAKKVKS